jgi:hypothetical protein
LKQPPPGFTLPPWTAEQSAARKKSKGANQ